MLSLALPYWQVLRGPELLARADNPRLVEEERRIVRGRILSRDGVELARSQVDDKGYVKRIYPYPALAPVVGYASARYGTGGIEAAANAALRGQDEAPSRLTSRNGGRDGASEGATLADTLRRQLLHEPTSGDDVVLTIDSRLQKIADEALGQASGAVVVLDPRNGEVLAMASHPYFDPHRLEADWDRLRADPNRPLLNRATQGLYAPGSTFKTVTLAAALDRGLDPTTVFTYTLRPPDAQHHGWWHVNEFQILCENHPSNNSPFDLASAYAWSCNVAFAEIGLRLGHDDYVEYARRFGLGSPLPLEIPVEPSLLFHTPDYFTGAERFYALASTAFGQGELAVTPLQMALIAATVANDGVAMTPHLVSKVRTADGVVLRTTAPSPWRTAVSRQAALTTKAMMVNSVDAGWARVAAIKGVPVGGKTGTAETGDPRQLPHSWFIGFAPADNPRFAIAVIKEFAGYGSEEAAPVGKKVLEAALKLGQ
jgi:peptidoglycan glycosyltransferase